MRNFVAPAVLEVVEGCSVSTALGPCPADVIGAGELVPRAEGRLAVRAAVGRSVLLVVEPVADGCDAFEARSSAQAIPQVVKIAAPTPSATASPPTRPMHVEALILHVTGAGEVLQES